MGLTYEDSMRNFSEKFKVSREYTEARKSKIPGGFSRLTMNYGPFGIFVERGEGQYIYTVDGHKMLDLNNNYTVNILGHKHPKIMEALSEVISKGYSFGNPTAYEYKLAEILCDRIESVERIKFTCSASEACMTALQIARGYTGKNKIAKFEGGYHGSIDALHISSHSSPDRFPGPETNPLPLPDSAGIPPQILENTVVMPQNDFPSCEKILRENASDVAGVIMELQSAAGGIVILEKEFVAKMRALTEELGIVLIFDETCNLRANYHGLQSVYGVKPDLTVLGKMIGGGLPIGAVGGSAKVYSTVEENQVQISGTHHGHALASAAGIACLEVMDEAAYARLNDMAARIKKELNDWAAQGNYPFIIYGLYSQLAYAFTDKPGREITTHRDFWRYANHDNILIFALEMATRGYFPVHRGEVSLSLPMTDDDITGFIETTKDIVSGIYS